MQTVEQLAVDSADELGWMLEAWRVDQWAADSDEWMERQQDAWTVHLWAVDLAEKREWMKAVRMVAWLERMKAA